MHITSLFILFLTIACGYALGRVRFGFFSLGISAVLLAGGISGHLGFSVSDDLKNAGLAIFMYATGVEAGPGFFSLMNRRGAQITALAVASIAGVCGLAALCMPLLGLDVHSAAGMFSGIFTSATCLATVTDIGGRISPEGPARASIAFAAAFPLSLLATVAMVQLLPRLPWFNVGKELSDYDSQTRALHPELGSSVFKVENPAVCGRSLAELRLSSITGGAVLSRVRQGGRIFTPGPNCVLSAGDTVVMVGSRESLDRAAIVLGGETKEEMPWPGNLQVHSVLVTSRDVVGKTLREMNLNSVYGATVTRLRRGEIDFSPHPDIKLRLGDRLVLVAPDDAIGQISLFLGNSQKALDIMDFVPFALGISLGLLISDIRLNVFGMTGVSLGMAAGPLLSGLLLSRLGKTGPVVWHLPQTSLRAIKELGLCLFFAAMGAGIGKALTAELLLHNLPIVLAAPVILCSGAGLGLFAGRSLFGFNLVELFGLWTGATTSTAALASGSESLGSDSPAVVFSLVYPVAMISAILCSALLLL